MVTSPGATAVTRPLLSTTAMPESLLAKVTLPPQSLGRVTLYCPTWPTVSLPDFGSMLLILLGALRTVTLQVAFLPLAVLTVMVQLPLATPVITPVLALTLAIFLLLLDQVTAVAHSSSPSGATVSAARPLNFSPTPIAAVLAFSFTALGAGATETRHSAEMPFWVVATTSASPLARPVMLPVSLSSATQPMSGVLASRA